MTKFNYFLFGALILVPFNFVFLGTQIFFVQILLIFGLIATLFAGKTIPLNPGLSLETSVKLYLAWVLVSFLVNFFFSFDEPELQARRLLSIGISMLFFSGYFVGKSFSSSGLHGKSIVNGILFTYILIILFYAVVLVAQKQLDLYVVRRTIGQRIPFVIGFASVLAMTYFFSEGRRNYYYLLVFIAGALMVFLSLTRAAYIQLSFSFLVFMGFRFRHQLLKNLLVFLILITILITVVRLNREKPFIRQIAMRIELLLDVKAQSEEDESGVSRLAVWKFLGEKLMNDPVRMIIGYGQLGPSQVASDFVLPSGMKGEFNAHSQYLDIIVREGVVGLLIFMTLFSKALRYGLSGRLLDPKANLFVFANSIGLAGVLLYGFFHETFRYPLFGFYFWIYLGMLSRIIATENDANQKNHTASQAN